MGIHSPVRTLTPTMYLDVRLSPRSGILEQDIPVGWNAFIYTLSGKVEVGPHESSISSGPSVTLILSNASDEKVILCRNTV